VKKLVETSVGRVVIDLFDDGFSQITLLDDQGWEVKEGEWSDGELAKGLLIVGLEEAEANAIERDVLSDYKLPSRSPSGGSKPGAATMTLILAAIVVPVLAVFVLGLAAIGWLIWHAVT
jgi:hypothetical protein